MSTLNIHCDGSCYNLNGLMGLGVAWFIDDATEPSYTMCINKHDKLGTSNEAEYLAIINALQRLRRDFGVWEEVHIFSDSNIIISQLNGKFSINGPRLKDLAIEVKRLVKTNPHQPIIFHWVPRTHPRQMVADKLSKSGNPYFINKKQKKVHENTSR